MRIEVPWCESSDASAAEYCHMYHMSTGFLLEVPRFVKSISQCLRTNAARCPLHHASRARSRRLE